MRRKVQANPDVTEAWCYLHSPKYTAKDMDANKKKANT